MVFLGSSMVFLGFGRFPRVLKAFEGFLRFLSYSMESRKPRSKRSIFFVGKAEGKKNKQNTKSTI